MRDRMRRRFFTLGKFGLKSFRSWNTGYEIGICMKEIYERESNSEEPQLGGEVKEVSLNRGKHCIQIFYITTKLFPPALQVEH